MMNDKPSDYEVKAIKEIHEWKNPALGWFGKAMEIINWPLDKAADLVTEASGVEWVVEKSIGGLVSVLNDFAQWSVRTEAIYKEFQESGHNVNSQKDIEELNLEEIDRVIGWLGMKYKSLAIGEVALTGAAGLPGIPPDVVAIITLNLRAIGEYATYCGFDISSQQERLFAMNVVASKNFCPDFHPQIG